MIGAFRVKTISVSGKPALCDTVDPDPQSPDQVLRFVGPYLDLTVCECYQQTIKGGQMGSSSFNGSINTTMRVTYFV